MERFFTRIARLRGAAILFSAALVLALAACPNPAGEEEPAQYTITFDSQEGSAVAAIKADEGTAVPKPVDPTREGYAFQGWFSEKTGGTKYEWPHTLNADLTMHAQWQEDTQQPVQHTITFNSQGGSAVAAITADEGTAVTKPTDPTRNNYTFQGWHSAATGGTAYTWPHTLTADLTMHARWQAIEYTITFESHGGSAVAAIKADAGTALAKPTDPTRDGYSFEGWFSAEAGGTLYPWPHALSADLTMHAHWQDDTLPEPEKYTITFESHGGTELEAITANEGTPISEPTSPTRNGYAFNGWFSADTGGAKYDWPYTLNEAVTMHAQWTAISYTISYNLNGGTGADNSSYTIESADITLPVPAKTGYTFGGWFDNSGFAGTAIPTIPAGSTGEKTFYAQWTAISYTIAYELNGGTNPANSPASYTIESNAVALPTPTKTGYTFGGWFDNSDFAGTAATTIVAGSSGNKTFWAKWTAVSYTITYNLNGGTGADNSSYTIESANITLPSPTRANYTFGGWFEASNFSGQAVTTIATGSSGNKTFWAKWTAVSYTIAYELNGGANPADPPAPASYTVESAVTLPVPTRTACTFIGWFDNSGFTGAAVTTIAAGSSGNKTFYAKWSERYAITYIFAQGDTGADNGGNPDYYTAESLPLTLKPPAKPGSLGKWYTNADFTSAVVTVIAAGTTGAKTFYAGNWASAYTITYHLNGGTGAVDSVYTADSADITLPTPTRTGYTFDGWFEDSSFSGQAVTTIATGSSGDKTFYAKWTVISYTIAYHLNGGTNPGTPDTSYTVESGEITLPVPTRDNYDFGGWFENSGFSGQAATTIAAGSVGNKTFYAKWTATPYDIVYNLNDGTNPGNAPASYTVESPAITLPIPQKHGYDFDGWFVAGDFSGQAVTTITAGSSGDKAFYAKWTFVYSTKTITIGFNYGAIAITGDDGNNFIYKFTSGEGRPSEIIFTASSDYTDVKWHIYGQELTTGNSITIKAEDYGTRTHALSFTGKRGGTLYSQTIAFTVKI